MAREYLVTGLTQIDTVVLHDGTAFPPTMGGTPMYGYCGMRPWTDSITVYTRVGEDFFEVFNPWFDDNGIDRSGIKIVSEATPCTYMRYDEQKNSLDGDRTFADRWGGQVFLEAAGRGPSASSRGGDKGILHLRRPLPL